MPKISWHSTMPGPCPGGHGRDSPELAAVGGGDPIHFPAMTGFFLRCLRRGGPLVGGPLPMGTLHGSAGLSNDQKDKSPEAAARCSGAARA